MIFVLKSHKEEKQFYLLIEANGSDAFFSVYDSIEKATHCSGSLGSVSMRREILEECLKEDYSLMEDNSEKRKVVRL